MKIVIVKWIDSTYYRQDEIVLGNEITELKPKTLYSTGFLMHETLDFISICQDYEPTTEHDRLILSIPKVSIFDIQYIDIELDKKI